ncbi:hypothetical protein H072_637 [Dactylellina haptotyla CBS 200.50]|uniref:Uncharacterized protein n=1 Tax=Dactylellina haptotyla (strain CBS 200.50) TaxID=1284197 RepID=S8CCU4_DACHA|nr:hypothetical protein H072_637 [Dactylellina haptotyla CBS 200.50]
MPPSSRSASSRPSLSSTRSTPPTDVGESNKMTSSPSKKTKPTEEDPSIDEEAPSAAPEQIALPSESTHDALLEIRSKDDSEIDAIFEQTASESDSPRRPPSIPDCQYTGPRNFSRLGVRDSEDEISRTPPPSLFGPAIRSATMNTAKQVAGENGAVLPSSVCESPSPFMSRSRMSSVMTSRGGPKTSAFPDGPIFSPFSSQKKKKTGRNGLPKGIMSPSRKGNRFVEVPVAPSPDPSPLVLLHVTLLPLPVQGPASSVLANHLRKMISPTVVARGLLLPHPNDDYDGLIEMIAENLGLDQETPPPFKKAPTYGMDDCASHSEGSYLDSSEDEHEPFCPNCSRRRLKPEFARHDRPRRHRRPFKHGEKWYTINIFASNGLMRAGAWSRSWEEMERIDVEVTVTSGYEDIEPARLARPSSQRSEGKRGLQGGFQFKRRMPPVGAGVETTTDEEMPRPRRASAGRRRPSGPRVLSGSVRSRNSSNYIKQEPLSELEILPDVDKAKDIYEEGLDTDVPIFETSKDEDGDFVPIWEDNDTKDGENVKPAAERMRSEDAWTTDDESVRRDVSEPVKSPSPEEDSMEQSEDENRRLSAFTLNTAIHHNIAESSRASSVVSDLADEPVSPKPRERKVSGPRRRHSSRRSSREIKPAEDIYAPSEKTASRPNSSRNVDSMMIIGRAMSDGEEEEDKENRHDSVDNKENIPVAGSDEESKADDEEPQYPEDDEDPEEFRPNSPRSRRAFTPKTAGPSPMPSRFSSPAISPDISPIASRAGSPQPSKAGRSRERRRRSGRRSFDRSFDTKTSPPSARHSRHNSNTSNVASSPARSDRGRSESRTPRASPTPSPSPLEKEVIPESLADKLRTMIKPTIDTLSAIPLPTLLLIAIPFAGLIAFSVNSYVQQKNLDHMVRNFMESQVAREMQILQNQQQAMKPAQQDALPGYAQAPQSVVNQVVADAEKASLTPEEQAEVDWRNAQKKGLDHESVIYGIRVGGECVMPHDVANAIRKAAEDREDVPHSSGSQNVLGDSEMEGEGIDFTHLLQSANGLDGKNSDDETDPTKQSDEDDEERGRYRDDDQPRYERAGSRSPPLAPYRHRDRSMERKNVQQQPYDYYQQPPNVIDDYYDASRMSDAGEIDVGKMDVRDGGLEDAWYHQDIPDMMLPPPVREIPASPSKVQDAPGGEASAEAEEGEASTSPYQNAEEPQHTPSEADAQKGAESGEEPPAKPEIKPVGSPEEKPKGRRGRSLRAKPKDQVPKVEATEDAADKDEKASSRPASRHGSQRSREESPRPIVKTGYTPQQRPQDYRSRPSSRNGEDHGSRHASRPPTRNGRAGSRPPTASRSASGSRPRPTSRSGSKHRSASRPRSSAGGKGASSSMAPVQEAETGQERVQETEYEPLNLRAGKESASVASSATAEEATAPAEPASWTGGLLQKFGFGRQQVVKDDKKVETTTAAASSSTPAAVTEAGENANQAVASEGADGQEYADEEYYEDDQQQQIQEQLQHTSEQYENYADEEAYAGEEGEYLPEGMMQEEYVFEDTADDAAPYKEDFDYEGFKNSF